MRMFHRRSVLRDVVRPIALAAAMIAAPASAQNAVEILIGRATAQPDGGVALVDIRLLNNGTTPQAVTLPDRLEARLVVSGTPRSVWLDRATETPATLTLPAGGFARGRYRLIVTEGMADALLSVPKWGEQQIALSAAPASHPAQLAASSPPAPVTPPAGDRSVGNAFLENLSAYEPIYAVYGPGTNSEARLQLSFRYQLYGSRAREDRAPSIRDGLYFAYTQRMFWDVGAQSSPFRNIDYQPELFYLSQPVALSDRATISGQIGMRHESNGRDGDASRSINTIYVAPMAAFALGGGWRLAAAPRLWLYVGDRSDNPAIRRYRGNSGLFLEIGEENGLRLSTTSRFNMASGKGAISADLSYPLRRILGGGPDFYLFAQSFRGYGENLLDYDKRMTRLRIGLAVVR